MRYRPKFSYVLRASPLSHFVFQIPNRQLLLDPFRRICSTNLIAARETALPDFRRIPMLPWKKMPSHLHELALPNTVLWKTILTDLHLHLPRI